MSYWYCLHHSAVEPDDGCAHQDRLGPYPDQESAQRALERARARTEAWDQDQRWNDRWDDESGAED